MKKRIIGVTGGVGSGKSTVLEELRLHWGYALILSDEVGHDLMQPGKANYQCMVELLGRGILAADGTIDRKKTAELVFQSPERTKELSRLTHPNIHAEIERRIGQLQETDCAGIVIESALLKEGGLLPLCDEVWYVYAQAEIRIARIIQSRGYDRKRCLDVMARQKTEEEFREEASAVIDNSGTIEETKKQIAALLA